MGSVKANGPVTAIIAGAGHRSLIYASYAELHPDQLKIVGVVEPDERRRLITAERFGISPSNCFAYVEELILQPQLANAVINGTMDELHVHTSLLLLQAGYDILLEKPIGISEEEVALLQEKAAHSGRTVMICHVLRYAPFYTAVKQIIEAGDIGEVMSIQTSEHVSYHHMAVSFIRGKWSTLKTSKSSMLMAKCCHDLDLVCWLAGQARPIKVSSFGSLMHFRPERAPEGSGHRCLSDCEIEDSCAYSAKKHYLDKKLWDFYVWDNAHLGAQWSEEQKLHSLRTDNPYGRCVWRCDNDVVDHQSVIIEFDTGLTASHNMVGATSRPGRYLHIVGTDGEIEGVLEEGCFVVRQPELLQAEQHCKEYKVEVDVAQDSHGGGDLLLVEDFVKVLQGKKPSISSTSLEKSIDGHRVGFAADKSREQGVVCEL